MTGRGRCAWWISIQRVCFPTSWYSSLTMADPDSLNGEKLILRTEYHAGAPAIVSKAIARRRTADEDFAPQTHMVYGKNDPPLVVAVSLISDRHRRWIHHHYRLSQAGTIQASSAGF